MFTADQLVAHVAGDYLLQTDHQAITKRRAWLPAIGHALTYAIPFLLLEPSPGALVVMVATHAAIDHYGVARYVVWFKNRFAPAEYRRPWSECTKTGYPDARPEWLATWLTILVDNLLHVVINGLALRYLP